MRIAVWLFGGITILLAGVFGTILMVAQIVVRESANVMPAQLTEETIAVLGSMTATWPSVVELSESRLTFVQLYSEDKTLLQSTATLDGQKVRVPEGVLEHALKTGENRVTWQPKPGVREAIVVRHFTGPTSGFVVAGASLHDVEMLSRRILTMVMVAGGVTWLVAMGCVAALTRVGLRRE